MYPGDACPLRSWGGVWKDHVRKITGCHGEDGLEEGTRAEAERPG